MNKPHIRTIDEQDSGQISLLISLLGYPLTPREAAERICILRKSPSQEAYVAMIDQDIVGLISVSFDTMIHLDKPIARITALVVDPKMRRMKIGHELVEKAIDFAHQNGCGGIEVTTNRKRQDAFEFYQNNGFYFTSNRLYREIT